MLDGEHGIESENDFPWPAQAYEQGVCGRSHKFELSNRNLLFAQDVSASAHPRRSPYVDGSTGRVRAGQLRWQHVC